MKESLYGWYPPARGQWRTHNQDVSSYATECLYKFNQSKFASEEGVRTPTPHSVKIRFASRAETIKTPARSGRHTAPGRTSVSERSLPFGRASAGPLASPTPRSYGLEQGDTGTSMRTGVVNKICTPEPNSYRPQSAISYQGDTSRPSSLKSDVISTGSRSPPGVPVTSNQRPDEPKRAWSTKTEATQVTMYDASGNPTTPMPKSPYLPIPKPDLENLNLWDAVVKAGNIPSPVPSETVRRRAQSATIRRETPTTPTRPVHSARPYGEQRSQSTLAQHPPTGRPSSTVSSVRSHVSGRSSAKPARPAFSSQRQHSLSTQSSQRSNLGTGDFTMSRPHTPGPPETFGASPPNGTRQNTSPVPCATLDYETELKKHKWKMEIPGDPLNLKGPCLHPRQSYVVQVNERPVKPNPPRGHMQNYSTFFLNTIPRKPLSFTLHPEMISEVLHAKRMQLQKRSGMVYHNKNFSFVY